MRDTFLLLWVGFLVIGVIGSIVSSLRKQIAQSATQKPQRRIPTQWQPPPGQLPQRIAQIIAQATPPPPKPVVTPPRKPVVTTPKAAPVADLPHDLPAPRRRARPLFRERKAIVQAVIAAEVLGKPRGLRDEYL